MIFFFPPCFKIFTECKEKKKSFYYFIFLICDDRYHHTKSMNEKYFYIQIGIVCSTFNWWCSTWFQWKDWKKKINWESLFLSWILMRMPESQYVLKRFIYIPTNSHSHRGKFREFTLQKQKSIKYILLNLISHSNDFLRTRCDSI